MLIFREKTTIRIMVFLLAFVFTTVCFAGCLSSNNATEESAYYSTPSPTIIITSEPTETPSPTPEPTPTPEPEPIEIILGAAGDIMVHNAQLKDANYTANFEEGYEYYFGHCFKYIQPALEYPDLMIGNLETVFASGYAEGGYTGFPRFNTPDSMAKALKDAGFDVLTTSNNHSLDRGKDGLLRTLDVLDEYGFYHTGTFDSQESYDTPLIIDVNGVKVGILAGSYGYQNLGKLTKEEQSFMISVNEAEYLKLEVEDLKKSGAQIIVASLHWGYEKYYPLYDDQKELAPILVEAGVDVIFGHHPHILQPIEYMEVELEDGSTNSAVVCWSLGNFIANAVQRYDREGAICYVFLSFDPVTEEVTITNTQVLPTYINFEWDYLYDFHVLPIVADVTELNIDTYEIPHNFQNSLESKRTDVMESITEEYVEFIDYIPKR